MGSRNAWAVFKKAKYFSKKNTPVFRANNEEGKSLPSLFRLKPNSDLY